MSTKEVQSQTFKLPARGFVFWPVGTGDSTTIVVNQSIVVQVDLHHLVAADDSDDPRIAIVDHLVKSLPKRNGKPYLALFALTHLDLDHCQGFKDLLKQVHIGELWFTPRLFREYKKDLCEDAQAFQTEAKRRVKKTIDQKGIVESGDRVRIIGYDELLQEDEFKGFPQAGLTIPGHTVSIIDGTDYASIFKAFVHAPFKDDCAGERNDTSLGLQITLINGKGVGKAMLLGDLCYPTIIKIFTYSHADDLAWNVFLAPHHCSKSVMYWKDEGEDDETLKQPLLDKLESAALTGAYIIASSMPIPSSNKPGDNPPHAIAKQRYQEIVDAEHFICTQEHPNEKAPEPVIFTVTENGFEYTAPTGEKKSKAASLSQATAAARGGAEPPKDHVGFGNR